MEEIIKSLIEDNKEGNEALTRIKVMEGIIAERSMKAERDWEKQMTFVEIGAILGFLPPIKSSEEEF